MPFRGTYNYSVSIGIEPGTPYTKGAVSEDIMLAGRDDLHIKVLVITV